MHRVVVSCMHITLNLFPSSDGYFVGAKSISNCFSRTVVFCQKNILRHFHRLGSGFPVTLGDSFAVYPLTYEKCWLRSKQPFWFSEPSRTSLPEEITSWSLKVLLSKNAKNDIFAGVSNVGRSMLYWSSRRTTTSFELRSKKNEWLDDGLWEERLEPSSVLTA